LKQRNKFIIEDWAPKEAEDPNKGKKRKKNIRNIESEPNEEEEIQARLEAEERLRK